MLRVGDVVDDVTFLQPDGRPVRLSELASGPLVLIFLRHLAWLPCLAHLGEVQERRDEIRQVGGELVAVSQGRPEVVAAHPHHSPHPFPVVGDPTRAVYRYFGLERGGWGMFFTGRALRRYLTLIVRGWRPRAPAGGEDVRQLGGDFVLDRCRRLVYAYRSADPGDRPTAEILIGQVRTAADIGRE
jgi:peroxiredoxin